MRINWLSILRGWVVILVIVFHNFYWQYSFYPVESKQVYHIFNAVFGFRMALFFFISGFLLYHTKIRKNSSFGEILKERIPRIIYPYLFFTLGLLAIKVIFKAYVRNPVDLSPSLLLNIFLYPRGHLLWPWLWFLNTLLIFFLLYPILKYTLNNKYSILCMIFFCLELILFFPKNIMIFDLSRAAPYLFFFYFGILFSKYQLQDYLKNKMIRWGVLIFFILSLFFDYKNLGHSISGIGVSIIFASYCSEKLPNLFSSFRDYYYQIYLIGSVFQHDAIWFFSKKVNNVYTFLLLYFFSIFLCIYLPVLISKIIQRLNWKPLLKVFGF